MMQLELFDTSLDDGLVARLVDEIGRTPVQARSMIAKFRRWGLDPAHEVDRLIDGLSNVVAVCPKCGLSWIQETPRSWWLTYDRCYACIAEVVGALHRFPTDQELAWFAKGEETL